MDNLLNPGYLLGVLKRRWWLLLLPSVVGTFVAVTIAYVLPPVYVSSARILVESQQIPTELARSTVSINAAERITAIEERLKTRQNMLALAEAHSVFANRPELTQTEIVARMRAATRLSLVSGARRGPEATISTVNISFSANSSAIASRVANALLTQVIEQNVEQRSERAVETLSFFVSEVSRLGAEIAAVEQEIIDFKSANELSLPESIEFRRNELATLQRDAYLRDNRRLALVQAKETLENAIAIGVSAFGTPSDPLAAELAQLRRARAEQGATFAASHPSMRAIDARLAVLETEMASRGPAPGQSSATGTVADAEREVQRIESEIAALDQEDAKALERIRVLDAAITRSAEVGVALGAIDRRMRGLQSQYERALSSRAEAETGQRLEVNQQAERFEVIEPPRAPDRPVSPNRVLIGGAGAFLSVGAGFALMVLAELLNSSVRTAKDVELRLNLRPVVSIPMIRTPREAWRSKWMLRLAVITPILIVPTGVYSVDRYVMPLPLVVEKVLALTGAGEFLNLIQLRLSS